MSCHCLLSGWRNIVLFVHARCTILPFASVSCLNTGPLCDSGSLAQCHSAPSKEQYVQYSCMYSVLTKTNPIICLKFLELIGKVYKTKEVQTVIAHTVLHTTPGW